MPTDWLYFIARGLRKITVIIIILIIKITFILLSLLLNRSFYFQEMKNVLTYATCKYFNANVNWFVSNLDSWVYLHCIYWDYRAIRKKSTCKQLNRRKVLRHVIDTEHSNLFLFYHWFSSSFSPSFRLFLCSSILKMNLPGTTLFALKCEPCMKSATFSLDLLAK